MGDKKLTIMDGVSFALGVLIVIILAHFILSVIQFLIIKYTWASYSFIGLQQFIKILLNLGNIHF